MLNLLASCVRKHKSEKQIYSHERRQKNKLIKCNFILKTDDIDNNILRHVKCQAEIAAISSTDLKVYS